MTKLRKAVEQTVRWYEKLATDGWQTGKSCPLCDAFENGDCCSCPIFNLENPDNKKGDCCDFAHQLMSVAMRGWNGDIPSCLAIMVYCWGFLKK